MQSRIGSRRYFAVLWLLLLRWMIAGSAAPCQGSDGHELVLHVFTRSDSQPCERGVAYARELTEQQPGLRVEVHDLLVEPEWRDQFRELAERFGVKQPGLPAFYVFDRLKLGFKDPTSSGPAIRELFTVHVYVRSGCPHCHAAREFFSQFGRNWPALTIVYHDLARDVGAQAQMHEVARKYNKQATGLPVIEICGQLIIGFDSDATTGRRIEALLQQGTEPLQLKQDGKVPKSDSTGSLAPPPPTARVIRVGYQRRARTTAHALLVDDDDESDALDLPPVVDDATSDSESPLVAHTPPMETPGVWVPGFGHVTVERLGLPVFSIVIGLVDGFNPCAMWVLVMLLSVLVNIKSRARMLAIAGSFVLVSGLVYFAFMAAWLNLFQLIGFARPLQLALGVVAVFIGLVNVKDFIAFHRGATLSIPEAAKPAIYARIRQIVGARYLSLAISAAVVLALMVNVVELLCTAGLPALFTDILTMQEVSPAARYGYLALYNLAYIFDDSIMVGTVVITLSRRRLQEREGRWLKLVSGVVMLALGLVMIGRPEWLQFSLRG